MSHERDCAWAKKSQQPFKTSTPAEFSCRRNKKTSGQVTLAIWRSARSGNPRLVQATQPRAVLFCGSRCNLNPFHLLVFVFLHTSGHPIFAVYALIYVLPILSGILTGDARRPARKWHSCAGWTAHPWICIVSHTDTQQVGPSNKMHPVWLPHREE